MVTAAARERVRNDAALRVPAAGSAWLAERLRGSVREAPVVATGRHAVYLRDGDSCLAVLDRHAVAVPIGLRTALTGMPAVRSAVVGGGRVRLGPLTVELARMVSPTVSILPRLRAHAAATSSWLTRGVDLRLDAVHRQLPAATLTRLAAGDTAGLVGRGDGFTPVGDDIVCGWLVTSRALGHPAVVDLQLERTTDVSGSLLLRACEGEAIPQLIDLLVAVAGGGAAAQVRSRLDVLLRVGSTSGAGLAIGAATALMSKEARP